MLRRNGMQFVLNKHENLILKLVIKIVLWIVESFCEKNKAESTQFQAYFYWNVSAVSTSARGVNALILQYTQPAKDNKILNIIQL